MIRSLKGLYHLIAACIANLWFGFPARKLIVVGVTGTDGKTTTTTLIYEILKAAGYKASMISSVHAVIGGVTYDTGFHVTTPDAFALQRLLRKAADHGDSHVVLEVTSHGLSQHRVLGIAFAVGVITNVTHEHLDWHGTFERYLRTKLTLLAHANTAIINRDETDLYETALPLLKTKKLISYAIRRSASVTPRTFPFKPRLLGEFNRYNCLAAIAACLALGVPSKTIRQGVEEFQGVAGRMEILVRRPFTVIVDFAHTPNAIDRALATARTLTRHRLIHVFGSAGLRDHSKRPLMGQASSTYADIIVLTEEDYRTENVQSIMDEIQKGILRKKTVYRNPNRGKAIAFAFSIAKDGDVIIITGKGHEKSICRGSVEYPWSDQKEVSRLIEQYS